MSTALLAGLKSTVIVILSGVFIPLTSPLGLAQGLAVGLVVALVLWGLGDRIVVPELGIWPGAMTDLFMVGTIYYVAGLFLVRPPQELLLLAVGGYSILVTVLNFGYHLLIFRLDPDSAPG